MHLAKVIGTVVASQKHEALTGVKLLLIQPVNDKLENKGDPIVAVDPNMQAGPGCVVSFVVGREAMLALPIPNSPVDAGIVGIVDEPINRETR
ncbi:MAG: EutN/CcmL family microcompartment protein [Nitrospinae bacterium]|nr:EutN/CcmL family microcompartment protein [Nitrospinota bacterium]